MIIRFLKASPVFLLVSALPVWVSLEWPVVGFLAIGGLISFFWWVYEQKSPKKVFLGGLFWGFLTLGYSIRWYLAVFPTEWAGVPDRFLAFVFKFYIWFCSSFVLALGVGAFSLVFCYLKRQNAWDILLFPAVWVLAEYGRNWLYVFASWGKESVLVPAWTFGALGYQLVRTPLVFYSRLAGLYGLSFIGAMLAAFIFFLFWKRRLNGLKNVYLVVFLAFILVLFGGSYFLKHQKLEEKNELKTAVFQAGGLAIVYSDFIKTESAKDSASGKFQPPVDLVVFPEALHLFSLTQKEDILSLGSFFGGFDGAVVTIGERFDEKGRYDDLVFRTVSGKTYERVPKYFLIPTGEYLPFVLAKPMEWLGRKEITAAFSFLRNIKRADEPERVVMVNGVNYGGISCSGLIAPELYRRLARDGAEVLLNPASHNVLRYSSFFMRQAEVFARFHAVANARPFIQSVYNGHSYVIGPDGEIVAGGSDFSNRFLYATIKPVITSTIYSRWGDFFALAPALAIVFLSMAAGFFRRRYLL